MPAFTFDLEPSGAKPGFWLLSVNDVANVADPDLADDEVYLVSREDLQGLEALIHQALYPVVLPPIEKFEVG